MKGEKDEQAGADRGDSAVRVLSGGIRRSQPGNHSAVDAASHPLHPGRLRAGRLFPGSFGAQLGSIALGTCSICDHLHPGSSGNGFRKDLRTLYIRADPRTKARGSARGDRLQLAARDSWLTEPGSADLPEQADCRTSGCGTGSRIRLSAGAHGHSAGLLELVHAGHPPPELSCLVSHRPGLRPRLHALEASA